MKMKSIIFVAALMAVTPVTYAGKGDAEAGKEKATASGCGGCHGMDGNSAIPTNPSLAGQNASYLAQALKDYKAGTRKNPIMAGQAAGLEDADIANLAAFYASQSGKLVSLPAK